MNTLFWFGIILIGFTYIGYGIVVSLWVKLRGKMIIPDNNTADEDLPAVTLLIACFNELDILAEKLENCRALDYPKDKLDILFITDGSSDGSELYLQRQAGVLVMHQAPRNGKIAAVKRAMKNVQTPITVLTDANTFLNPGAVRRMVADFADPTVGAVAGEKRVISQGDASSGGEGLYWKYESFLKRKDS
ncbi:MAG: glycosyltransferase, partial [Bacteroidota bacterium]